MQYCRTGCAQRKVVAIYESMSDTIVTLTRDVDSCGTSEAKFSVVCTFLLAVGYVQTQCAILIAGFST